MGIKVTLSDETAIETADYPYMGVADTGNVVLFTSKGEGFILVPGPNWGKADVGHHSRYWDESRYTPLIGRLELSNE